MASLDDIWDIPADEIETVPAKSNAPLFLPSDESDNDAGPTASSRPSKSGAKATTSTQSKKQPSRAEIDALFADIDVPDDFQELAPALDLDALRRQADARNAHKARPAVPASRPTQTQTQSQYKGKGKGKDKGVYALDMDGGDEGEEDKEAGEGKDKKKKRKPVPKMDEARLLGKDGFPALIKTTKDWKPRGKGHEVCSFPLVLLVSVIEAFDIRQQTLTKYSKCTSSGQQECIRRHDFEILLIVLRSFVTPNGCMCVPFTFTFDRFIFVYRISLLIISYFHILGGTVGVARRIQRVD